MPSKPNIKSKLKNKEPTLNRTRSWKKQLLLSNFINSKTEKNNTKPEEIKPINFKKGLFWPGIKKRKKILKSKIKKIILNIQKKIKTNLTNILLKFNDLLLQKQYLVYL